MGRIDNLIGKKFGELEVIARSGSNKQNRATWLCGCSCGNEKIISGHDMKHGGTISCGCVGSKKRIENLKRGAEHSKKIGIENEAKRMQEPPKEKVRVMHQRLSGIWYGMKDRCYSEDHVAYNRYGGRGITICEEWLDDYFKFEDWALDNGYSEELTIDRIDNDRGYSPNNCRWATQIQQMNNRSNNNLVEINGTIKTISQWARQHNLAWSTIKQRVVSGKTGEEILARPEGEKQCLKNII